jgi:NADH-quinone oxidoreductase subunit J
MRAAFALLLVLASAAALYVLATADFAAVAQLMLYVGGILILIIFGVMFTSEVSGKPVLTGHHYVKAGSLAGISFFGLLCLAIYQSHTSGSLHTSSAPLRKGSGAVQIGELLFSEYVLVFEIAGVLLLIALLAVAFIAGRNAGE